MVRLLITRRWGSSLSRDQRPSKSNFSSAAVVGVTLNLTFWLCKSSFNPESPYGKQGIESEEIQLAWKHLCDVEIT